MNIEFFKNINSKLLLFYFLSVICAAISIEALQYNIMQNETSAFTLIVRKFRSLFDACILMLPFFFINKRRWIIFILLFLLDIFCLSQIWYFRTYQTLMPFSSYFLFDNVSEILIKSIIGSIHPGDIWVILPTILLLFSYLGFYRNNIDTYEPLRKRIAYSAMIFIICSFGYLATPLKAAIIKDPNRPSPWIRWTASFGPSFYVEANGLVPYFIYTLTKAIVTPDQITPEEKNYIDRFILSKEKKQIHNTVLDHPRRNLIIIIVESLNSWLLNKTIDGIEITPNLNRFIKEDSVISALHILPQVKDGRSSDGHLMINTGILPLQSGAAVTTCKTKHFPSLADALKPYGYYSANIISDAGSFWNQKEMSKAFSFDTLYDKRCLEKDDMIRGSISDKSLMQQSFRIIKNFPEPFFCQIVTASTHMPYDTPINKTRISESKQFTPTVRNCMEAFHYTDQAIGSFIDSLKKNNLYKNSTIVIVSDHDELGKNVLDGRKKRKLSDREIAMIILNAPLSLNHKNIMGQIDIYPTLLDVMGLNDYSWRGVGHSILQYPVSSAVHWDKKSIYGNSDSPLIPDQIKAWDISNLILSKDYFGSSNPHSK